ncbi:hypothetical protein JOC76_000317 [Neobacillus cucumis]|nr:hypothetical protein [Neobacillus cucumis]
MPITIKTHFVNIDALNFLLVGAACVAAMVLGVGGAGT